MFTNRRLFIYAYFKEMFELFPYDVKIYWDS